MNERQAEFKVTIFKSLSSRAGIDNNIKIPKSGNNNIYNNKFLISNIIYIKLTFYRNRTYDLQFRKLLLYPTELKTLKKQNELMKKGFEPLTFGL